MAPPRLLRPELRYTGQVHAGCFYPNRKKMTASEQWAAREEWPPAGAGAGAAGGGASVRKWGPWGWFPVCPKKCMFRV